MPKLSFIFAICVIAVFSLFGKSSLAQNVQDRPVMVGGSAEFDACWGSGVPKGLNPKGDNFLALKESPSLKAKRKAKLGPGQEIIICDQTSDGQWLGVLIPRSERYNDDCGLPASAARRQAYKGPCLQGWVSAKYVKIVAG